MSPNKLSMNINEKIVNVTKIHGEDYICLTDMAKSAGSDRALHSWLRARNTVSFLGLWEQLHNTNFNLHEFVKIKTRAGENSFNPSIKEWVEATNSIGIISKTGRYGGTYAHKDIAFEFGTWLSPGFKLMIITEFQRLKANETNMIEWDSRRYLSRVNYKLHTDAIKEYILPSLGAGALRQFSYTTEADMLNRLVFGQTASEWRVNNPSLASSAKNQRDYATTQQLILMANLESLNSHYIAEKMTQTDRINLLAREAKRQYESILELSNAENKSENKPIDQGPIIAA